MNKHRKILFFVYSSIFLIIAVGFLILVQYSSNASKVYTISSTDSDTTTHPYVTITSSKEWRESVMKIGKQYDGTFYNPCNHPLTDWTLEITLPKKARIDSSWNFQYIIDGDNLVATCMDYNEVIPPNESITFGFIMISNENCELSDIAITVRPVIYLYRNPFFWVLIAAASILLLAVIITIVIDVNLSKFRMQRLTDQTIIIQSMRTFANFIDAKDRYTKGHSIRVAAYSRELAKKLMLPKNDIEKIYYVGLLHDVGKISVPDAILNKPLPLSGGEKSLVETHTIIGGQMLKDFTAIKEIREGALYHHEHYDGSGYPEGRKGNAIPLYARIICVADSYDAMSSDRCYRNRLPYNKIIEELTTNAGRQFDPDVVACMLELLKTSSLQTIEAHIH